MEFETVPVDLAWLSEVDRAYAEFKRTQGSQEERSEKALAAEFEAQKRDEPSQRELERRFKKQEAEREEAGRRLRDVRERDALEADLALSQRNGFHFTT